LFEEVPPEPDVGQPGPFPHFLPIQNVDNLAKGSAVTQLQDSPFPGVYVVIGGL
jgi:hypothetical protein